MDVIPTVALAEPGPRVSRLVAGMMNLLRWQLSVPELVRWLHTCLDLGITTFDHADIYGDYSVEAAFGQALRADPGLRPRMQLVTKCGIQLISPRRPDIGVKHYNTDQEHIVATAEESLRLLGTDSLDLLLIHRPDPLMDADAVAGALTALRQAGKVRHCGVSNFRPWQFRLLAERLDFPLVTNQIEISVMHLAPLHDGTLDQCQQFRIAPMAWSPFAGGRLFHADTPQAHRLRGKMAEIGEAYGNATVDQVALAWLLAHPARIVPVLGTGSLDRWRRAIAALDIQLDRPHWFAIWQASAGHEVP